MYTGFLFDFFNKKFIVNYNIVINNNNHNKNNNKMKKLYLLAALLMALGCSHIQKNGKEAQQNQVDSTIIFYSLEDNYMGFYEITKDSLAIMLEKYNESYHYYVYDSTELIAQGDYDCICLYDSTAQWRKCIIEMFADNQQISSVEFILSYDEHKNNIELSKCSVTDLFGHEYLASGDITKLLQIVPYLDLDLSPKKESKIVFYAIDSLSQSKIEFCPDSITSLLIRCVNREEENNPYVVLDEENCKYSVSFFPMEDSISKVVFFFSSNPDGTDISLKDCLVTLGDCEMFECSDIQRLDHCTSFILYPELDGPLMKNFIPENE